MKPSPAVVVDTITALVASDWPTAPAEVEPWLVAHGVRPEQVREIPPSPQTLPGARHWSARAGSGWGEAQLGWVAYHEEFVGLAWFLWHTAPTPEFQGAARTLADALSAAYGPPEDTLGTPEPTAPTAASATTAQGGPSLWRLPSHTIDLYTHLARSPQPGLPPVGQCVQLEVDLSRRADALEQAARERFTRWSPPQGPPR